MAAYPQPVSAARIELLLSLGRPQEAAVAARQLLALDPHDSQHLGLLGLCLLRQQQHLEAIHTLHQAISAGPLNAAAFAWLAEAQFTIKNFYAARLNIEEALRLAPGQAAFYGLLSIIQFAQFRPREALRAARAGLALDAADAQCQNMHARALAALGRASEGAVGLAAALPEVGLDTAIHTNLGLTYLQSGNSAAAQQHLAEALRQDATNQVARQGLLDTFKGRFWLYRALQALLAALIRGLRITGLFRL